MSPINRKIQATFIAFLCASGHSAAAENWPGWRGPRGSGVTEETGFPLAWSGTQNVRWKAAVEGRGHSSPVIWGDYVFLLTSVEGPVVPGHRAVEHKGWRGEDGYVHPDSTGADHRYTLKVLALERASGKLLWERSVYEGPMYDNRHRKNTYASSTPATDGERVYAFFDAEGLYCLDFEGNLLWKRDFPNVAKGGMGPGMSPVLFGNLVIVLNDVEYGEGSYIMALDKKTGARVWRTPRKHRRSWATPLLVEAGGRTELVANGAESVIAYDPANGLELWRAPGVESHPIPSPVNGHGLVILTAGSQAKRALAVRLGGSGDLADTTHVVWRYAKGTAYVPSPILFGDYVYLMTDKGILTCLDARSGELQYEGGRVPVPATFTASPVAFDGVILLTSEDGDTFVIKAGPQHEILRTNSLGEPVFASPALSSGEIFIRGEKHLYCISKKPIAEKAGGE
jgi:outer membrane protein assembly factor BamB